MRTKILMTIAFVGAVISVFFFLDKEEAYIENMPPQNDTVVAFGDSLVDGVGAETNGGFVTMLERDIGTDVINLGVPGETTADGLGRVPEVLGYEPGIVIILFGGNDALRKTPIEETAGNLATMIQRFHEAGVVVVLVGVRGGLLGDPYDEMFEELSDQLHTAYVPNVLEGILLRPELTYDQLHPNDKGYAIVAERVGAVLMPILERTHDAV